MTISGAMDKFTAKGNGGGGSVGGVALKRTKTVLQNRTYMEGGYMKTVREEVEVTDDEEVCGRDLFLSSDLCILCVCVFFQKNKYEELLDNNKNENIVQQYRLISFFY